jgi:ATP synthase protein I
VPAGRVRSGAQRTPASETSVIVIDLPQARRLAFGVVLGQAAVTVLAGVLAWAICGERAAFSALLGGGIGTASSLVLALAGFSARAAGPERALRAFYRGEALKLVVVVGLFMAAFRLTKVAPLAMFAAFAATFFVYWIALATALWPAERARDQGIAEPAPRKTMADATHTVRD